MAVGNQINQCVVMPRPVFSSSTGETVHLQYPNFKVATSTKRWIVERGAPICFTESDVLVHPYGLSISSANCYHFRICRHEQLSRMMNLGIIVRRVHPYPRVFCSFRVQTEQKCFACAKVGLSLSFVVFQVSFAPSCGAVGTKYFIVTGLDHQ